MCQWGGDNWKKMLQWSLSPTVKLFIEQPHCIALRRECNEGNSHPQNLSVIFCIESSLDIWVAEAPMMAALPYSQKDINNKASWPQKVSNTVQSSQTCEFCTILNNIPLT